MHNYEFIPLIRGIGNPFQEENFVKVYYEKPPLKNIQKKKLSDLYITSSQTSLDVDKEYYVEFFKELPPTILFSTSMSNTSSSTTSNVMSNTSSTSSTSSTTTIKDIIEDIQNKEYFSTFNIFFGTNWVLTGSEAIRLYLKHFHLTNLFEVRPKDRDVLYLSQQFTRKTLGEFIRKQTTIEKTITFTDKKGLSFDIILKTYIPYFVIDGVRLFDPKQMIKDYVDNKRNAEDIIKINALKVIIEKLEQDYDDTIQYLPEKTQQIRQFGETSKVLIFEDN